MSGVAQESLFCHACQRSSGESEPTYNNQGERVCPLCQSDFVEVQEVQVGCFAVSVLSRSIHSEAGSLQMPQLQPAEARARQGRRTAYRNFMGTGNVHYQVHLLQVPAGGGPPVPIEGAGRQQLLTMLLHTLGGQLPGMPE